MGVALMSFNKVGYSSRMGIAWKSSIINWLTRGVASGVVSLCGLVCGIQVTVTWRDPSCSRDKPLPPQQTAQFKLSDKSVQVFARGLSTAVL